MGVLGFFTDCKGFGKTYLTKNQAPREKEITRRDNPHVPFRSPADCIRDSFMPAFSTPPPWSAERRVSLDCQDVYHARITFRFPHPSSSPCNRIKVV